MAVFARLRQRRSQQQQPISTAPMARNTENPRFSRMAAGNRSKFGKFDDFRRFAGLHQSRRLQRKIEARFSVANFCLSNVPSTSGRGWISGFFLVLLVVAVVVVVLLFLVLLLLEKGSI